MQESNEKNSKRKAPIPSNRVKATFCHDPLLVREGTDAGRRDPPLLQLKCAPATSVCELKG